MTADAYNVIIMTLARYCYTHWHIHESHLGYLTDIKHTISPYFHKRFKSLTIKVNNDTAEMFWTEKTMIDSVINNNVY
jgi:hypothetical protein